MKRVLLLCVSLAVVYNIQAAPHYISLLKEHSPDGYFLLKHALRKRYTFGETEIIADPASRYINTTSVRTIAATIPTAVHEASHLYTDIIALYYMQKKGMPVKPDTMYLYYTGGKRGVYVSLTPSFHFSDMQHSIPKHSAALRFQSLIHENAVEDGAGVYELLNEWTAYYWESSVCMDILPLFVEAGQIEGYYDFFQGYISSYTGAAEFRFYLMSYLLYARINRPEIYSEIYANSPFKDAVRIIDLMTYRKYTEFFILKSEISDALSKERVQLKEDDKLLTFTFQDTSSTKVKTLSGDYTYLVKLMRQEKFKTVVKEFGLQPYYPEYVFLK